MSALFRDKRHDLQPEYHLAQRLSEILRHQDKVSKNTAAVTKE